MQHNHWTTKYQMVERSADLCQDQQRTVYGLTCTREHPVTGPITVCTLHDISCNPALVRGMADLFTLCELDPQRLPHVVANLLP